MEEPTDRDRVGEGDPVLCVLRACSWPDRCVKDHVCWQHERERSVEGAKK